MNIKIPFSVALVLGLLAPQAFAAYYPICSSSGYRIKVNVLDDHPVGIIEIARFDPRRKSWTLFGDELGSLQVDATGRATVYGKRISQFVPASAVSASGDYRALLRYYNGSATVTQPLVCKALRRR